MCATLEHIVGNSVCDDVVVSSGKIAFQLVLPGEETRSHVIGLIVLGFTEQLQVGLLVLGHEIACPAVGCIFHRKSRVVRAESGLHDNLADRVLYTVHKTIYRIFCIDIDPDGVAPLRRKLLCYIDIDTVYLHLLVIAGSEEQGRADTQRQAR